MKRVSMVHVCSVIPGLSDVIVKKLGLPEIEVVPVKKVEGPIKKYGVVVTESELSELQKAKIIIADGHLLHQVHEKLHNAEWVQLTWAGNEGMAKSIQDGMSSKPTFPVTRMGTPIFSQLMAEHVIGQIISHERSWLETRKYQTNNIWCHDQVCCYRSLSELTVAVLGVGQIGAEVVRALRYFKCTVLGYGRSKTPREGLMVDEYFSSPDLPALLKKCDYIVNVLPSTRETDGLLGKGVLSHATKQPVLINIGRGSLIADDDTIMALDESWISAAILDVFDTEPLPASSPLWQHPKVTITPHTAGISRANDIAVAFSNNLKRYENEESLLNIIDWDRGY